jgi:hypothetical protein
MGFSRENMLVLVQMMLVQMMLVQNDAGPNDAGPDADPDHVNHSFVLFENSINFNCSNYILSY